MRCCFCIVLFFGVFNTNQLAAQTDWQWARSGGGKGYDQALSIAADSAGEVFVAGFYNDSAIFSGTKIHSTKGSHFFLAKYSPDGALLWIKTSSVKGHSQATGLCLGLNKFLYLTGSFSDSLLFGDTLLYGAGANNLFLIKCDLDGKPLWAVSSSGGSVVPKGLCSDETGRIYLCGSFSGTAVFGGNVLSSRGASDIFIARYETSGLESWAINYGSGGDDAAESIAAYHWNTLAITGSFNDTLDFGNAKLIAKGLPGIFTAQFTTEGRFQWGQQVGDSLQGTGKAIAYDQAGNIYMTGELGPGNHPSDCDGNGNIYTIKYNSSGEKQWSRCPGTGGEENGNGIAADSAGNIFVTGAYDARFDFGTGLLQMFGLIDMFVLKYNASGKVEWADHAGSVETDYGTSITLDPNGNLYLAGVCSDTAAFGLFETQSNGLMDGYIAKIGSRLAVGFLNCSEHKLSIFPNPAKDNFVIKCDSLGNHEKISIILVSMLGESVREIHAPSSSGKQQIVLSLEGIASGTYICRISGNGWSESQLIGIMK